MATDSKRKSFFLLISFVAVLMASTAVYAQDSLTAVQQRLTSEYRLAHPSGDEKEILSPGTVLVLKVDKLVMVPISNPELAPNVYKDGKITQNVFSKSIHAMGAPKRIFVATEKMWVTEIEVKEGGVVFNLLSDPIDDVRYKGALKFPFAKGIIPSFAEIDAKIAEVFDGGTQQARRAPSAPPASRTSRVKPPPPVAPPPPPPDAAPTATSATAQIAVGQTPQQVMAAMGKPQKIVTMSNKQIYVYKDMKVTFVANKVTDVE